jgi:hypothetical protein
MAVIFTVSSTVGPAGECETETDGDCVSMLNVPMDEPCEHESGSDWPVTSIFVNPFWCVERTVNE